MADTKISALTELAAAPDAADVLPIVDDPGGTPATKKITVANLRAGTALPVLHVRDEKASGTDGGGSSAGTWNVRDLNTVKTNQITGASLASNQITLPAGTYRIRADAPAFQVRRHQIRLQNVTDTAVEMVGTSEISGDSSVSTTRSFLTGRFTIAAEKTFELQHWTQDAEATFGLGVETSSGEVEVYAEVWIEKEA